MEVEGNIYQGRERLGKIGTLAKPTIAIYRHGEM
jgi:hypothetical protein